MKIIESYIVYYNGYYQQLVKTETSTYYVSTLDGRFSILSDSEALHLLP